LRVPAAVCGNMSVVDFTIRPLTAERWPALEDLFGKAGASNGCWCMYWRIGPRYRDRPQADNKHDLRQLAESAQPPGLLAFDGDIPAGWCELAPRADLGWLAHARYLKQVCFPAWRQLSPGTASGSWPGANPTVR
jgi:hypothetical protein